MQLSKWTSTTQQEWLAMNPHRYITYGQLLEDLQKLGPDELLRPVIVMDHNNDVDTVEFLMYGEDASSQLVLNTTTDQLEVQPALML